ncbi:tetratricopeptide repeat protein [Limibaculum sp. FT325]|uniref:tetratricopeptide repeat protein n=1 Tax=Thermohalobaculum sediminis TaxID=2939436 RepID=UPI0020BEE9E3|nr:tetratricopeptide repeat protein [Limibaculum sediminis]MCL5777595.1 tetratricopeptide repeat protein [Limibaculum sediminis]
MLRRFTHPTRALCATAIALLIAAAPLPSRAEPAVGPYLAAEHAVRNGDVAGAAMYYAQALAGDQSNTTLLERTILAKVAAGQVETAVPIARRLDAIEPGHAFGALVLAADAIRRGAPDAAREALAAVPSDGSQFLGLLLGAWSHVSAGDVPAAVKALAELEADEKLGTAGQMMAAYHLGLVEASAGNDAAAAEALARAAEKADTPTLRLVRIQAGVLARLGRAEEARALITGRLERTLGDTRLEELERAIADGTRPAPVVTTAAQGAGEAFFGLSGYLSRGANRTVGLAYARLASFLDPDLIEAKLLTAQMLRVTQQYDAAIAAYESVPRDAPEALEAMIGRAESMQLAERADAAIVAMREVAARYPRSIEAQNALGDLLRREERFEEAAVAYDATIRLLPQIEPHHWVLFYQRGIAYERSKQWDLAEPDFLRALELEPDQPLVLNYLGYSWIEMGRNFAEARAMIEKAVEQRPEDGYIVDSLGWVLYRLGEYQGAVEQLERAVEINPVDPVINDHYGDALWMIGRRTEARFQWKRALSFEPEEKDLTRIRRKLEVGLDTVLAEESASGTPAVLGAADAKNGG